MGSGHVCWRRSPPSRYAGSRYTLTCSLKLVNTPLSESCTGVPPICSHGRARRKLRFRLATFITIA